jgi:hypothetical protein
MVYLGGDRRGTEGKEEGTQGRESCSSRSRQVTEKEKEKNGVMNYIICFHWPDI